MTKKLAPVHPGEILREEFLGIARREKAAKLRRLPRHETAVA